jgi:hypothetical protein
MASINLIIDKLPEDLINYIKDFTLTPAIRLQLFYQKNNFDENKLKKMLTKFTSKQLEQINWKYLYYKIYKTSPPLYDNNNLVQIFNKVPNKVPNKVIHYNFFTNQENEPSKIYTIYGPLWKYQLNTINRSDYYSENVHTEMGRKRQQYKNIIGSWKAIHEGQGTAKIPEVDDYFQNLEFELIKTITLLQKKPKIKSNN